MKQETTETRKSEETYRQVKLETKETRKSEEPWKSEETKGDKEIRGNI